MDGASLVYSSNGVINASVSEVVIGRHTSAVYFMNIGTSAIQVTLNGLYSVYIPGTLAGLIPDYICIPGDYTRFQSNVSAVNLSIFAVA